MEQKEQNIDNKDMPEVIETLVKSYSSVFEVPNTLPPSRNVDHAIPLVKDAMPFKLKAYRYPHSQKTEIENQVQDMLNRGTIKLTNSSYASPAILIKTKDKTWHFCVDYRHLNNLIVKDRFPIHNIDELLDELCGARFFMKLELRA